MVPFTAPPGIRVVRPLTRDEHLETLMVHIEGEEPGPAVIARACDAAGARRRRTELAALARGHGPGLVTLLDVLDDAPAPALLLAHVVGPTLATVLGERPSWTAGETVSVLGALVSTVARLHEAGVAHGAVSAARIVLAATGPILTDLSHAELFAANAPESVRARVASLAQDREAVRGCAIELLARVDGSRSGAAHELATRLAALPGPELLPTLGQALRELASPMPVASAAHSAPEVLGARMLPVVDAEVTEPERSVEPARDIVEVSAELGGLPARIVREVRQAIAWARRRLEALPAMRRRLLIGGGVATAVAAVLLAVPGAGSGPADTTSVLSTPLETTSPAAASASAAPASTPGTNPAASPSADARRDDPLAALSALLARRDECIRLQSLLCLEDVDQAGSAALDVDRAGIAALRAGEEARLPSAAASGARVVETLGDGVLIELGPETAPASLLLMRGEAGWRIRDWIAAGD